MLCLKPLSNSQSYLKYTHAYLYLNHANSFNNRRGVGQIAILCQPSNFLISNRMSIALLRWRMIRVTFTLFLSPVLEPVSTELRSKRGPKSTTTTESCGVQIIFSGSIVPKSRIRVRTSCCAHQTLVEIFLAFLLFLPFSAFQHKKC